MATRRYLKSIERHRTFPHAMFRIVFGREPNLRRDKNFLMSYLGTIEKTSEEIIQAYLKKGISKSQLEAIYETGITPTNADFHKFPRRTIRKWMKIANHQQSGSKIDARLSPIIYTDPVGEAATTLYLELSNSVIRICHLLDTGARDARASDAGILFLYLLARSVQILRSIRILVNNDEVSSVLTLARGLYEVFGRLLFVNRKPELAQSLVLAGYVDGERFEFGRNKAGSIDRRKVRECSTGKEYRCDYSLTEIFRLCEADRDAAIHRDLYYVLSAEVHPTADLLSEFVVRRGFLLHRAHDTLYTMYILGYLTFLLWREIAVFPLISRRDRRDAKHALNVVREALLAVIAPLKPVVEKGGEGDRFKPLFMGIYQVVMEPYGDNYWLALDDEECGGGDSEGAVL